MLFVGLAGLLLYSSQAWAHHECGISPNLDYYQRGSKGGAHNRIFGGKDSNPEDWPFVAHFSSLNACTASIIGKRWVLLAAHCYHYPMRPMIHHNGGVSYTAAQIVHENFTFDYDTKNNMSNDIMLIKLTEPLVFSEKLSPVCLYRDVKASPGEYGTALGYGVTLKEVNSLQRTYDNETELKRDEYSVEKNELLRETQLILRDEDDCPESTPKLPSKICAGGEEGRGTTYGDSGGPFVVLQDDHWVQYGICSEGFTYPVPGNVKNFRIKSVFTRVSSFCDWIEAKTKGEVKCH